MLRVDLRELAQKGAVETRGELKQGDPALEGTDIALKEPVAVNGRLQAISQDRFYWQGTVHTVVAGECRRCLTSVATPLDLQIGALFSTDGDTDDPDAYPVASDATEIDVTPAVREELVLAAPRFALCREDCKGLCPHCGKDLNTGACECKPAKEARWLLRS